MKKLTKNERVVLEYLMITVGTALMAFATKILLDPQGLIPGGFTGVAIIVKYLTRDLTEGGVALWVTNLVLNVPLIPIVIKLKGWRFAERTLAGSLLFSFWLAVIPYFQLLEQEDIFLAAVYGGILMGAGIGLVFLGKGTTGGTDMCGAILQHFFPHLSVSKLMQLLDVIITAVGVVVFGIHTALYAILTVYLTAKLSDRMMEGMKSSVMAYIISDHADEIARVIMDTLDRGVTGLHGSGMYTNTEKKILMCVTSPRQLIKIKDIVRAIDERAFVIVNDSREVLGEGFVEY